MLQTADHAIPQVTPRIIVSYSEAASGLHTGYQGTDALANLTGTPYSARSPDFVCRGGIQRRGNAPAFGGVFLPRFFLRYRRKNRAPGGRKPCRLADIKT